MGSTCGSGVPLKKKPDHLLSLATDRQPPCRACLRRRDSRQFLLGLAAHAAGPAAHEFCLHHDWRRRACATRAGKACADAMSRPALSRRWPDPWSFWLRRSVGKRAARGATRALMLRRCSNGVRRRVAAPFASLHAGSSMIEQMVTSKLTHNRQVHCRPARTPHSPPNKRNVVLSWQAFLSTDNFFAQCCYPARSSRMVGSRRGVGPDPALTGWS
jgi:hypothetical protein